MTHPTWELPISKNSAGLVLTPCPGTKGTSLDKSIEQLKTQGVTVVVTALSMKEMKAKNVDALPLVVQQVGLQWFNIPIEDDCAPDASFQPHWDAISPALHQALDNGEKVALHCMGGSGRTGLLAAHLLLEKNWQLEDIINQVQALRPNAFTKKVQAEYIHHIVKK
ncbi:MULTISPECIES: cyclin-dependent kinase inhibitor 3 family protein [unclassified Photobacterium]|uniref:cyclin-dependent kinase inhibitor 3 family protein n=1 Tax=unclassified Photobacterium TaxID=2628852 RepID=UPI001EDEB440|nr:MULTISPECIES: cyclin-dependent kinase inhibitor 3 family protein [unclassified Photobacterium]MCG3862621.1 cyclin-dependent kinase inhibitor 3 family protein [Photobacterium sp. Ph6]MCG3874152.1 cyclin-dependent kinase inhibitor 3 family protein [Photobacterium sp. Ph5]